LKPIKKAFPDALEKLKKKFGSADYSAASELMRESFVKVVNSDYKDRLHKINVPTLLLWGEKDTATPISDAQFMKDKIKDSGLVTVKNGGHFCFTEDFGLVARVLASFFNF
jgi:pimeloyl-ACP methyl ester carboxylesterase